MAAKYEEHVNYFDMDLKGVFKLNKTARLRLNLYIQRLEKRQEQSMVKLDHDIRETKRQIAKIEDEKNKLVMKLLKSYVRKTTQRKKKSTRVQESVSQSGAYTGFTFSTYLDVPGESTATSNFHPPISYYKRPHSLHVYSSNFTSKQNNVQEAKAYSEKAFPVRKHLSRNTERRDIHTRVSNLSEMQKRDIHTRISKFSDAQKRDIHSRISKDSCVTELPATRGQLNGTLNSEYIHNQKIKEMLGGNTCLFRGHPPPRGYKIEPTRQKEKGIIPKEIHPDDHIKASKLLERIQVFGNVKLPNNRQRKNESSAVEEDISPLQTRRLIPTLPSILSNIETNNKDGSSTTKEKKKK